MRFEAFFIVLEIVYLDDPVSILCLYLKDSKIKLHFFSCRLADPFMNLLVVLSLAARFP